MKTRFTLALVIGLAAQMVSLGCYSFLARIWPQSSTKNVAFLVLIVGSVWAVQVLLHLSLRWRIAGLLALALSAPLVPLFAFPKAREMLSDLTYYGVIYAKGVGVALVCYAVLWGAIQALALLMRKRAENEAT